MDLINRDLTEHSQVGADTQEWHVVPSDRAPLADHGIRLCGVSVARPGFRFVRQGSVMVQVLATCSGRGVGLIGREWLPLTPGVTYRTPTTGLHAYQAVVDEPWVVAWVMWNDATAVPSSAPEVASSGDAKALRAAILGLHREVHGTAQPSVCVAYAALIDQLGRRMGGPEAGPSLRAVWEAVSAQPDHTWTLHGLAERAGLSPERLRRRCHRETGRSPMQRVTELRLHHAAAMLASTRLSVAAIAERVGYSDAFAFSTAFRRLHGYPPSAVRAGS